MALLRRLARPGTLLAFVALGLFAAVARTVPWEQTWAALRHLTALQVAALIAANVAVLLTFSGRWWLILAALGQRVPYFRLVGYRLAAFGVSYFTPGPQFGGEPLQVYLIARRHAAPMTTAIASVVLDKTLELLANFTFLAAGIATVLLAQGKTLPALLPPAARGQAIFLAVALLSLPVAFFAALWAGRRPISGLLGWLAQLLSAVGGSGGHGAAFWLALTRAAREFGRAEDQAALFYRQHPGVVAQAAAVSALSWAAMIGEYWLALHLLGAELSLVGTIAALTAARIAFLLPLPGGLGVLEASQVFALTALGVSPALAMSLVLLIRARDITLGAVGLVWARGVLPTAGQRETGGPEERVPRTLITS